MRTRIPALPKPLPVGMNAAEWLANQLDNSRESGEGFVACCPAHDDRTPSLSITEDHSGKVLFHCHAGCEQSEIIDALKERGLWPVGRSGRKAQPERPNEWTRIKVAPRGLKLPHFKALCGKAPSDVYVYRDSSGKVIGYVCRIDHADGSKRFIPITPWQNKRGRPVWRNKGFSKPKPLFGLDDLAKRSSAPVLMVEGEKTATAAADIFSEYVVVTWPGGANGNRDVDFQPLNERDVTMWPDADEPGRKAATEVANALSQLGVKRVRLVDLPTTLPTGWDLADEAPDGFDPRQALSNAKFKELDLVSYILRASDLAKIKIKRRDMIVAPFLETSSMLLLYARRGIGKTWLSMSLGISVATGKDFLVFKVPKARRVLYVDGEMPLADLQKRVNYLGAKEVRKFFILPSELLFRDGRPLNINAPEDQRRIEKLLDELERRHCRPELLIFDNLSALRSGVDENDNAALDGLLRWMLGLRHRGYAILVVHHAGKSGDQRGASRLEDFLDTTIKLERSQEESAGAQFDMVFTKTRCEPFEPVRLELSLEEDDSGLLSWHYEEAHREEPSDKTLRKIYFGPRGDKSNLFKRQIDIATALGVKKSTISKHVHILKDQRLIVIGKDSIAATEAGEVRLKTIFRGETFH